MRYRAAAFMLCFLTPPVFAQTIVPPSPGQRVWVRSTKASGALDAGVKGTLEAVTGDSLRVRPTPAGPALSLAAGPQTRLFVFTGRRSSAGRGAAIGGVAGVLAGAIIGFAGGGDCYEDEFLCFDRGTLAAAGALTLGGVGLVGGLIVGALSSHETWARTGWSGAVRPVVLPSQRGVGLGLSLTF
jgi:hypothetical protein